MKYSFIIIASLLLLTACQPDENELIGAWDDQIGQILKFEDGGEGQWIFYKNGKRDTFEITYKTDPGASPNQLDFSLKKGSLEGKALYGIYEFTEEGNLRFDCERQESARPDDFGSRQAKIYVRVE